MEKLSAAEKKKRRAEVREKVRRCRERAKAAKVDNLTKDQLLIRSTSTSNKEMLKRESTEVSQKQMQEQQS